MKINNPTDMFAVANPDNSINKYNEYIDDVKIVRFGLLGTVLKSENDSKMNLFRCILSIDELFLIYERFSLNLT